MFWSWIYSIVCSGSWPMLSFLCKLNDVKVAATYIWKLWQFLVVKLVNVPCINFAMRKSYLTLSTISRKRHSASDVVRKCGMLVDNCQALVMPLIQSEWNFTVIANGVRSVYSWWNYDARIGQEKNVCKVGTKSFYWLQQSITFGNFLWRVELFDSTAKLSAEGNDRRRIIVDFWVKWK